MDTMDTTPKRPTLAEALSAWAAASYAHAVAAKAPGSITDPSGLAKVWWRHGQRLHLQAVSLMEGVVSGRWRGEIPGLDFGVGPIVWSAYTGRGGLDPRGILARGELLAAGSQNVEALGELVLEWREEDRTRAQKLADVTFSMGGSDDYVDPTMTPEEFGAYREQEEDAKERESWGAEQDAAWIDDTDSLPTVPEGFDAFDPAAALEGRGDAAADTETNEEDTDR